MNVFLVTDVTYVNRYRIERVIKTFVTEGTARGWIRSILDRKKMIRYIRYCKKQETLDENCEPHYWINELELTPCRGTVTVTMKTKDHDQWTQQSQQQ